MRARKKKWAPGELENNPRIMRDMDKYESLADFYVNKDKPLHVEIGCGKGRFIAETSRRNPDINYIAIEREPTILATAARLGEASEIGEVVYVVADVENFTDYFRPGEISRLYMNFSDPWPKKRSAKRRLTHENFLSKYAELKIPEIFFKTDNRPLFEFSLESFCKAGWLIENISLDLHNSGMEDNIMTEYEEKFSPHGPIYRLEARPRQ